jgi:hypothetical protein
VIDMKKNKLDLRRHTIRPLRDPNLVNGGVGTNTRTLGNCEYTIQAGCSNTCTATVACY